MHKTLPSCHVSGWSLPGALSAPTTSCWIRAADGVLATAGLAPLLDDVLSVERVGAFAKPDPRVYHFAVDRLGVEPAELAFLTANAWDAAGAAAAGLSVHSDQPHSRPRRVRPPRLRH